MVHSVPGSTTVLAQKSFRPSLLGFGLQILYAVTPRIYVSIVDNFHFNNFVLKSIENNPMYRKTTMSNISAIHLNLSIAIQIY